MADLILHHYASSPFSEKVRLILGFKSLAWKSVEIPAILPKPDVVALTGGYRRTPVLQIGADVYCDTALIAEVLEARAPTPTLYPSAQAGLSRTLAEWADSALFWTVIAYSFQPAGAQAIFAKFTPDQVKTFVEDRKQMRGGFGRMAVPEATAALTLYLERLAGMLASGQPYLLGHAPGIADFSVYHGLWYVRRLPPVAGILDPHPSLKSWMDRMAAFGHGRSEGMTSAEAVALAARSESAAVQKNFVDVHGLAYGERVSVMPTDYALDPVEGELVLATENELAVRRTDPRAGELVAHFPRLGYQMRKVG